MKIKKLSMLILLLIMISWSVTNLIHAQIKEEDIVTEEPTDENRLEGIFTHIEGDARKKPDTDIEWLEAYVNSSVIEGDKVKTLKQSRAEIELEKENILRLAESTTIDIVKLYEEEKEKAVEQEVHLEEGDIWSNVSKLDEKTSFKIKTDVSISAIRGTVLRINTNEDSTKLKVYHGEVEIKNTAGQRKSEKDKLKSQKPKPFKAPVPVEGPKEVSMEKWIKIVKNMQEVVIPHDQPWSWLKRDFSQNDLSEQSDWVKWNKERDLQLKSKRDK